MRKTATQPGTQSQQPSQSLSNGPYSAKETPQRKIGHRARKTTTSATQAILKPMSNPPIPPGDALDILMGSILRIRTSRLTFNQAAVLVVCAREARLFSVAELSAASGVASERMTRRIVQDLKERRFLNQHNTKNEEGRTVQGYRATVGGVERAMKLLGLDINSESTDTA